MFVQDCCLSHALSRGLPSRFLAQPTRKSVSTTERKRASWHDIQSGHCYCGVFTQPPVLPPPHPPLKLTKQMSGGGTRTREGSWDSCPWPLRGPRPSVPLSDSRNRREAVPRWAVPEQVASHVGPGRWGPGQRKGVGARVSVPGDRGSQLDLVPLKSQWADPAPGLADHVLSKALLGQRASRDWVA